MTDRYISTIRWDAPYETGGFWPGRSRFSIGWDLAMILYQERGYVDCAHAWCWLSSPEMVPTTQQWPAFPPATEGTIRWMMAREEAGE